MDIIVHSKRLPQKALTNLDLEQAVRDLHIRNFRGVFMRNSLPKRSKQKECGILNLDETSGNGTHWTCYWKDSCRVIYFDSYGLPPPKEIVRYFSKEIFYNSDEIQPRNSVVCGHLCLYVLKSLSNGQAFDSIVLNLI